MPFLNLCLKEADIGELIEISFMQEVLVSANKNVQDRMKGPCNCSKLSGTQHRPKTVTVSSYNTLTPEKHRNL